MLMYSIEEIQLLKTRHDHQKYYLLCTTHLGQQQIISCSSVSILFKNTLTLLPFTFVLMEFRNTYNLHAKELVQLHYPSK